tara:strand:- start:454 stop:693 length:240 start_codon:yes stop_codon:yes gene_type:complete
MKALKTSKGAKKGGRPKKPKSGLINVAPYMRFIRKVCSHKLVYDQLDKLEHDMFYDIKCDQREVHKRIAQIKKDIKNLT